MRQIFLVLFPAIFITLSFLPRTVPPAFAQSNAVALQDSANAAMAQARDDDLGALSPTHFERARKAYDEAQALLRKNGDQSFAVLKFRVTLDELQAAQGTAQTVRLRIPAAVSARSAARQARADSLVPTAWQRAEQEFARAIRDLENGRAVSAVVADEIAGSFRAARRDALRSGMLGEVWRLSEEMDRRRAEKTIPTLSLRVHQAISRAEAALAQDNPDVARVEGEKAARLARRALDIMSHIEKAQKSKAPWEAAVLPYDDVLDTLAGYFQAPLDYSRGVGGAARPLLHRIRVREDSLLSRVGELEQSDSSLEQSLADAQTSLADAQNRVLELERRMNIAEGERTTSRAKLQLNDQISRAQNYFTAGEATVLQNDRGQVVIRLHGLSFAFGAANLDNTASRMVDKAIIAMDEFPDASISVEAHTDAEGSEDSNQQLSEARAKSVSNYLAAKLKLPIEKVFAFGFGESRPIADNETSTGRARNRRVEIVLTLP